MFPIRVAAADIGSNAIRFLIAEFRDAETYHVLDQDRSPVRLGHDVFLGGEVTAARMVSAVAALEHFAERAAHYKVQRTRAVATSAVRESSNGADLIAAIKMRSGLDVEVIDGTEEARLVYVAVRSRLQLRDEPWLLVDLGGGSLELSLIDRVRIHETVSLPIGAVRLLEIGGPEADISIFHRQLDRHDSRLRNAPVFAQPTAGIVATGGNIEALAMIARARVDRDGVMQLEVTSLSRLATLIAATTMEERMRQWQLNADRADVILPAALVYERVAELAGAKRIVVPGVGVKEGIILDLAANAS